MEYRKVDDAGIGLNPPDAPLPRPTLARYFCAAFVQRE